jgi:hypothetical protein
MVAASVDPTRNADLLADQALVNLSAIVAAHAGFWLSGAEKEAECYVLADAAARKSGSEPE